MSDAAIGTAIGLGAGLLLGIALTVLGAILVVRFQRQRRELGYEILSANVVIPKLTQANPAATVMVRRSALEGRRLDPAESDELVAVEEILGFRVGVRNCGNVVLHSQPVRLTFDGSAKVILANMETAPELGDERVEIGVAEEGNSVLATFPFLNPRATAIVSVQTVYNRTRSCQVVAAGPDLRSFDMARQRKMVTVVATAAWLLCFLMCGGLLLGLGWARVVPDDAARKVEAAGFYVLFAGIMGAMVFAGLVQLAMEAVWTRKRS